MRSSWKKINRLTKKAVTAEEVYVFSVRLCDDQVDRDDERFRRAASVNWRRFFIGKTGVMDHVWSAEKQVARIFDTEVLAENGATYLKGWAYMLRGAETDGLIREIDGGIKKGSFHRVRGEAQNVLDLRRGVWRVRACEGVRRMARSVRGDFCARRWTPTSFRLWQCRHRSRRAFCRSRRAAAYRWTSLR